LNSLYSQCAVVQSETRNRQFNGLLGWPFSVLFSHHDGLTTFMKPLSLPCSIGIVLGWMPMRNPLRFLIERALPLSLLLGLPLNSNAAPPPPLPPLPPNFSTESPPPSAATNAIPKPGRTIAPPPRGVSPPP